MDSRYGPSWLTKSSGNKIIHALGARGLISRCWDFLFVMDSRFIKPNQVSINTILNHCKQSGNITGAIELIRSLPSSIEFIPDEMTYHTLFEMAWRKKSYNLAKVVWRYACLNAATTRSMRVRMIASLQNSKSICGPDQSQRQIFGHSAGQFISAIRHFPDHPVLAFQREFKNTVGFEVLESPSEVQNSHYSHTEDTSGPNQSRSSAPSEFGGCRHLHDCEPLYSESDASTINSPTIRRSVTSVQPKPPRGYLKFISLECGVFQWWRPVRPLADMLVEAWELDQQWISGRGQEKQREIRRIAWKLQNAITVPIQTEISSRRVVIEWK